MQWGCEAGAMHSAVSANGPPAGGSDLIIQGFALARVLGDDFHVGCLQDNQRIGGDAVGEEDAGADGAAGSDRCVAVNDGGAGINRDAIFERRMTLSAAQGLPGGERTWDQADALIQLAVVAV